jgi:hypothetical protein
MLACVAVVRAIARIDAAHRAAACDGEGQVRDAGELEGAGDDHEAKDLQHPAREERPRASP